MIHLYCENPVTCPNAQSTEPFVSFKTAYVSTIVEPVKIESVGNLKKEVVLKFSITEEQAKVVTPAHRVQLRLFLNDWHDFEADLLPPGLFVQVNEHINCWLELGREGSQHILDITSMMRPGPFEENTVQIHWPISSAHRIPWQHVAIYLERMLNKEEVVERLKTEHLLMPSVTCARIREKLNTGRLFVSLRHYSERISVPCRSAKCTHVGFFDALLYLQQNELNPQWKCPLCSRPAAVSDLWIDQYFLKVLESPQLHPQETAIELHDGGFSMAFQK